MTDKLLIDSIDNGQNEEEELELLTEWGKVTLKGHRWKRGHFWRQGKT